MKIPLNCKLNRTKKIVALIGGDFLSAAEKHQLSIWDIKALTPNVFAYLPLIASVGAATVVKDCYLCRLGRCAF